MTPWVFKVKLRLLCRRDLCGHHTGTRRANCVLSYLAGPSTIHLEPHDVRCMARGESNGEPSMGFYLSAVFLVHVFSSVFGRSGGAICRVTPLASQPCIRSISSRIATMMQSYPSAVWLRSGGCIRSFVMETMAKPGLPLPRIFMVGAEAIRTRPMNLGVQDSRSVCGFQAMREQTRS